MAGRDEGGNYSSLALELNIDSEPWRDLDGSPAGVIERICGIPRGTNHGNAAVGVAIRMEDGSYVIAQTTLRLLWNATQALAVCYGNDVR